MIVPSLGKDEMQVLTSDTVLPAGQLAEEVEQFEQAAHAEGAKRKDKMIKKSFSITALCWYRKNTSRLHLTMTHLDSLEGLSHKKYRFYIL